MDHVVRKKSSLSLERRKLFEQLLKKEQLTKESSQSISPRGIASPAPLSFFQEQLWVTNQLLPDPVVYNIPILVSFTGKLKVHVLEQCIQEIICRHEILRTTFVAIQNQPMQVICPASFVELKQIDLSNIDEHAREEVAQRYIDEHTQMPFDLQRGPLLRTFLIKLDEEKHWLVLVLHHIIGDGWSIRILRRELAALYTAFSLKQPSPLPALSIQYADFALWQREGGAEEVLEQQLLYWRQQLHEAPTAFPLPTYTASSAEPRAQEGTVPFSLSPQVSASVRAYSQRQNVTLFMLLFTAYAVLLYRYTGQEDFVVGIPINSRHSREVEALIGFLTNTLPLRILCQKTYTFEQLLLRIREVMLNAFAHQDISFKHLVEDLHPRRSGSSSPLFQVFFSMQEYLAEPLICGEIEMHVTELETGRAQFDLQLDVMDAPAGIRGVLKYKPDLFEPEMMDRMAQHFCRILEKAVAQPDQSIADIPFLTEHEYTWLVTTLNETEAPLPTRGCIHELVEEQVEKTPDAIAVIDHEHQITYRQLDTRANQLAHWLRSLGVGPEVLVGVCLERRVELLVALLAILKAGGGYVPLDPHYPAERLAWIAQDAHLQLVLTQHRLRPCVPASVAQILCLDIPQHAETEQTRRAPASPWSETAATPAGGGAGACSQNVAYLIYTSGSTGRPKGVAIEHRSAVAFLSWVQHTFSAQDLASVLAATSLCFDLSLFELFGPLTSGGQAVLCEQVWEGAQLSVPITLINTVPSAAQELLRLGALPASVRTVNVAGEPLSRRLVEQLYAQSQVQQVYNLYGPSETTTYSTGGLQARGSSQKPGIGRPISNTRVYVLDERGQVVPVGVEGDLFIGGVGVARGYWGRAEITGERFVPDPWCGQAGARMYATGDRVRYRRDGTLEYVGRRDQQVKVRGFRIELGEIEENLRRHPVVQAALVQVYDQSLVAYLTFQEAQHTLTGELEQFLQQRLPPYMVPSFFVILDHFPLTPNGKIDRRALPSPDPEQLVEKKTFAPPQTAEELELSRIWSDVLGLQQVGILDNFFALGGHSLKAAQLVARVRDVFGVHVSLRSFFQLPTIAALAQEIAERTQARSELPLPISLFKREETSRPATFPLSAAQQRLWFLEHFEQDSASYTIFSALHVFGPLDSNLLDQCIQEIVQRHEILRTTFAAREGEPTQIVHPIMRVPLERRDFASLSASEQQEVVQRVALEEARRSFDLSRGPLLHPVLLRLNEQEHIFLLSFHHIIADGWSLQVFYREMTALYTASMTGADFPLPDLEFQYGDFVEWQRQQLQGALIEQQRSYWRNQLAGMPTVLNLPLDKPRPPVQTFHGALLTREISRSVTQHLQALGQQAGATLYMVLLAGFLVLLSRYGRQEDVVVGTPVAKRDAQEFEHLIGLCVNTLVLRTSLAGNPVFRSFLEQVRETCLQAYANQDVPFEQIVEMVQPDRNLSYSPLFQVMFNMYGSESLHDHLHIPGFHILPLDVDAQVAQFDLTLDVQLSKEQLRITCEYNTDLFLTTTIVRMLDSYLLLLEQIAAHPDQRVAFFALCTSEVQQHLLVDLNQTESAYPSHLCAHQLFEAQTAQTPVAPAVWYLGQAYTYQVVNQRANQLAAYLRKRGVCPETSVGLCTTRSLDLMIGLLGILKAGGSYVPLHPSLPSERLAYILDDASISLVVTQQQYTQFADSAGVHVVALDTNWPEIAREADINIDQPMVPDNLAYIIYTSGTTGHPKGVQISHRALVNHSYAMGELYRLQIQDRILQFAAMSFDVFAEELFPTWFSGASVVLFPYETILAPLDFLHFIQQEQVTVVNLPTSFWQSWFSILLRQQQDLPLSLRLMIVGSERVHTEQLLSWQKAGGTRIDWCNGYGPTETTITATLQRLHAPWTYDEDTPIAIGHPIANMQAYILDDHGQPMPFGIPGELYLGGPGLARGYLNQPALTAASFIPHPFSARPGQRLYRTGDLVRYLPDGTLEYLGRIDTQTKIRGFRIELAEIEAVLSTYPSVQECAITTFVQGNNEQRIAAYYILANGAQPIDQKVFHAFLRTSLPEYMIPTTFMLLESLPRMVGGKVDRRALPDPRLAPVQLEESALTPHTSLEQTIVAVWREVLAREHIGLHDNFFDLGGHSLLLIRLQSQLQETLQRDISLVTLFQYPTVSAFADYIDRERTHAPAAYGQNDGSVPLDDDHERTRTRLRKATIQRQRAARGKA